MYAYFKMVKMKNWSYAICAKAPFCGTFIALPQSNIPIQFGES